MRAGPLKLKLQMVCGDLFAIGPGKADLLEAIEREGSISAAGRALGMSYRRAWILVNQMNRCFAVPLVVTLPHGGRGARVTNDGRAVLAAYRALERDAGAIVASPAYEDIAARLLERPRS